MNQKPLKMTRLQKQLSLWLLIMMIASPVFLMAQSDKNLVRQGNNDYQKGAYNEAEINYRKALDKNPANTVAQFNLGGAMYSQENYEKAAEVYSATDIKEKTAEEKSAVYYNLGNSMLKAGKANEAVEAYKQALRENPKNEEARYNLEYLRQKQQQQNKDQNKDQDDKKDQDKKDQDQNKDQEKQEQDQKDQKQDQQDQNKDQQDKQQDQSQDKQDQQQGQQNEQQAQKISKKDAERMLDALKNNEKKTLEKLKKAKKKNARVIKSEKDW